MFLRQYIAGAGAMNTMHSKWVVVFASLFTWYFCPRPAPRLISCPLLFDIGYFPRPAPRIIFCLLILLVDGVIKIETPQS